MAHEEKSKAPRLTRRRLLLTAGTVAPLATVAGAAVIQGDMPWQEGESQRPAEAGLAPTAQPRYQFFNPAEAAFIEAAVAQLIPADDLGPGAVEAGVPVFIDRQLAGEYGRGLRWYMQGPWGDGTATQGYQTRLTPAALYRAAIREIDAAEPGQLVRQKGHDFVEGTELLEPGQSLTPAMLNLAAAANYPELEVARRPKLALLSTGDELMPPGSELGPDQIIASNAYGLVPLLSTYADKVVDLGIIKDDRTTLEKAILGAFDWGADVLITTGGASVGERDFVQDALRELGVNLDFWKIAMRPGKPVMFGTRGRTLVFGLPGNPISAFVTAVAVVRPALRQMTGHTDPFWPFMGVPLAAPLAANGERRHFIRARLARNDIGVLEVTPIAETDSNHSSSLAQADALIVQPEQSPALEPGDIVEIIPLNLLA